MAQRTKTLTADCHQLLAMALPLTNQEAEFLDRLNGKGEHRPDELTDDERLRDIVRTHPGLLWKALNVRQRRGLETNSTRSNRDLV